MHSRYIKIGVNTNMPTKQETEKENCRIKYDNVRGWTESLLLFL